MEERFSICKIINTLKISGLILILILLCKEKGWGQPWNYHLGTGTGTYNTASGTSTTFLPAPPSGTTYVRIGTGGGSVNLENPGVANFGVATEIRAVAPTTASIVKLSVLDYTPGKSFYTKFSLRLGGGSSGTWSFWQGDGANFSDANTFSGAQMFTGIRWVFGAGTITSEYRNVSVWSALGSTPFTQSTTYEVEIYGNNTTATINYVYGNCTSYNVAANKWDIWVNGALIGDELAKAALGNDVNIDSWMFYGETSTGNVANLYIDDFIYSNTIPTTNNKPSIQPTSLSFANVTETGFDVSYTQAHGYPDGYIVLRKAGTAPTGTPTDNTSYSVGNTIGDGTVAYIGSNLTFTESSLSCNTNYYYAVFAYNGSAACRNYFTTSPLGGFQLTSACGCTAPTAQASFTSINAIGSSGFTINFGAGTGGIGRLVAVSTSPIAGSPVSGTSYTSGLTSDFSTTTPTIASGEKVVYKGSGTSVAVTGLNPNTLYYVKIFEYNTGDCYLTTGSGNTGSATTLCVAPTTQATSITFGSITANSMTVGEWTNGNGSKRVVKMNTSNSFTPPSDGTDPSANSVYGGSGEQVIYNNTGTSVAITGLSASTTYWFKVYEYNCTGASTKYLTSDATDNPKSEATTSGAATTIVNWDFPSNPDNATADGGIAGNLAKTITRVGGTVAFDVAGFATNAATGTGWDGGSGSKYYQVEFITTGYQTIKVSSKQRSSDTGPKDFKLQYKISVGGTWTDVTGGSITVANNWTSGIITDLSLNTSCEDVASLYLRWIMTSNTSVDLATVQGSGSSRIDDILVTGIPIPIGNSVVFPVTASETTTISSLENTPNIIYNTEGTQVWKYDIYDGNGTDNDADALPTIYKKFIITQGAGNTVGNWFQTIQSLKFFEDGNTSQIDGNLTINPTSIVFTPTVPISVADGAGSKKTISMRISLKNPLPINSDNTYFQFKLIRSNVQTESSATSSQLADFTINSDVTKNKIVVLKTKIIFKTAPSIVPLNTNFIISIAATDANSNIDLDATDNVTLAKFTGTGTASSASGLTKALVVGIYTWSDVQYNVEEIFVLQATAGGLTTGYSNNIQCVNAGTSATTIVTWDFPLSTDNQYADGGIALNYDSGTPSNSKPISITGASGLIYTTSGYDTRCAYATGWNGGSGSKFWQVYFETTGYSQIKVSSKQKSSGTGPKNWKIQYKIGAGGTWTDVAGNSITVGDDWTTGVKTDLELPSACNNQTSVYIRWIMTTNTSVDNATVQSSGTSRIDDIIITGVSLNSLTTSSIAGSPYCITSSSGISVDVPFTSVGTYNSGNIYNAQLSNASGSFTNPVDIGSLTSTNNSGTVSATIPAATPSGTGYRIRVVSSNPIKTGSDNGENLIIILNTPNVSNVYAMSSNAQVTIGWNNPVGCYNDVMIIGRASSSVTATPSGDGSSYTENLVFATGGSNANLPANEYCLYKGITSGQIITGLTNDITYYFKIFVRNGSDWSTGIEITATPTTNQTGDFRSKIGSTTWNTVASWESFDGSNWVAASTFPNDKTKNVTIKNGTTVKLTVSGQDVKNLTVENGGKFWTEQSASNYYIDVYGSNIICNGIIGNGSTIDGLGFNIEGVNVTISGTGTFDAIRMRKTDASTNSTTNLIIAMDINLRWNAASGTQFYNNGNAACNFNVTLNSGSSLNLILDGGTSGNASIDGVAGLDGTNLGGIFTINGTMNIPGILYATTNNTHVSAKPCTWVIGNSGVINCNQVNCNASTGAASSHTIRILNGGKLNLNTNTGFTDFSSTNNVYDFQDGSTVEYSSPSGTQTVKATIDGVFEYSNLLISTNGGTKQLAGAINVKRDLTITGGVLDAGANNITVGRNWDNYNTSGFTEGTSTVSFNGTSAQTITCIDGENFNNLDFSNAGTKTLLNKITAKNITINSGSGAFIANDKNISVSGNWSNYGTAGFTEGSLGTVTFNGTGTQTLSTTGGEDFYNLTLNKTASTYLDISNDVNIANTLTLTSGILRTSTNTVKITNTSYNAVTGVTSGADRYIEGRLQWNTVAGIYTFPVGYDTYGAQGFDFSVNTGNGNVLAFLETRNQDPLYAYAYCDLETNPGTGGVINAGLGDVGTDGILDKIIFSNSPLQWNITNPGAGVSNYDVTFYPNGSQDIVSVTTVNGLSVQYIMKNGVPGDDNIGVAFGDALPSFADVGFYACPNGNTLSSLTTFSKFTKHGAPAADAVLPIELLSFNAIFTKPNVEINWSTASEINNDYFTLEKSKDGINFNPFSKVNGAGNSNITLNYSEIDNNPFNGISYYRLKQTDFDGKYSYSNIVSVYIENQEIIQNLWFNKDDNQINVEINSTNSSEYTITAYDICGKQLFNKKAFIDGKMNLKINTDNIPSGIYTISIISDYCNFNKKVVIITK